VASSGCINRFDERMRYMYTLNTWIRRGGREHRRGPFGRYIRSAWQRAFICSNKSSTALVMCTQTTQRRTYSLCVCAREKKGRPVRVHSSSYIKKMYDTRGVCARRQGAIIIIILYTKLRTHTHMHMYITYI